MTYDCIVADTVLDLIGFVNKSIGHGWKPLGPPMFVQNHNIKTGFGSIPVQQSWYQFITRENP